MATIALAQEETWAYALPKLDEPVTTITIGRDGTGMLRCEDGGREAMVGPLGFYDKEGQRRHTSSRAATPAEGQWPFFDRLDRAIDRVQAAYPEALSVGRADGAPDNWNLKTQVPVGDFDHATPYLGKAAAVLFAAAAELRPWIDDWCHRLKPESGAAGALIAALETRGRAWGRPRRPAAVESALTSVRNQDQGGRMNDAAGVEKQLPIGRGVTAAACKVLVKPRLGGSGMTWKERGAAAVLSWRCLTDTPERWSQFWSRIERGGFPVAA